MALAPEWMSYTKEMNSTQGPRMLGKERERGSPKYGKQRSYNNLSYLPPSAQSSYNALDLSPTTTTPFACSVTSPPAPPHAPPSILGDPASRVLNRSKSSPGFGSPKSKPKKSPDRSFERAFPSFKPAKPKAPKPSFNPSSYGKSHSQPNLLKEEKTANWHQQKLQTSSSASSCTSPSPLANSSTVASPPPPAPVTTIIPPSPSPPLPPPSSNSPPLTGTIVPEIDKLKQLIPTAAMPPKSVRSRGVVGPPLPMAKKPPAASQAPTSPSQANSLAAYFRKATSEPSLMHHKGQAPKKRGEGLLKEAVDTKMEKRSNFFQNIIKQEELGVVEDDSPIGNDYSLHSSTESDPTTSPPASTTPPPAPSPSPPLGLRSPLPEDMEDEERFLRTLGWVPEDEEQVPVLDEEEIADMRVKIFLSNKAKGVHEDDDQGVPLGIDVDVGVK